MAGIGFQLRNILAKDNYKSTLQAYVYAGVISSGPWALSILSVMVIGLLSLSILVPAMEVRQFLVSVTYLMASSLILTGGWQLFFTRYVSDRQFEKRDDLVLPNLFGMLLLTSLSAGLVGFTLLFFLFKETTFLYQLLLFINFIVLCDLWIVIIFLSGMKAYQRILLTMLIGYGIMIASSLLLAKWQIYGLLTP